MEGLTLGNGTTLSGLKKNFPKKAERLLTIQKNRYRLIEIYRGFMYNIDNQIIANMWLISFWFMPTRLSEIFAIVMGGLWAITQRFVKVMV